MLAVKVLTVPGGGGGGHDASRKGQDVLEEIHQEIELMSSLSHVNIVQYLGAEMDARARELFIFQEYAAQPGCHVSPCILCETAPCALGCSAEIVSACFRSFTFF